MAYTASLSKSQGREGWSIIFRHPALIDESGKPGKRVRRGLGTRDKGKATALVNQMSQLLADESFWQVSAKSAAQDRFDKLIVDIFYDKMTPENIDFLAIRETSVV